MILLKAALFVELLIAIAASVFLGLFGYTMATDSSATPMIVSLAVGAASFSLVFFPFAFVSHRAFGELKNYAEKRTLIFNSISAALCLFLVFPLFPLWFLHLYLLGDLGKQKQQSPQDSEQRYQEASEPQPLQLKAKHYLAIVAAVAVVWAFYALASHQDKEAQVIAECARSRLFTKNENKKQLIFVDRVTYKHDNRILTMPGVIEGDVITINSPTESEAVTKCLEDVRSPYTIKYELAAGDSELRVLVECKDEKIFTSRWHSDLAMIAHKQKPRSYTVLGPVNDKEITTKNKFSQDRGARCIEEAGADYSIKFKGAPQKE